MKDFILGIVFTIIVLCVGAYVIAEKGYINFQADQKPSQIEAKLAMGAVDASTDRHTSEQKNPVPATEDNLVAGAKVYMDHCAGCHGLPSNPDGPFPRSFYPPVPEFFTDAPDMADYQNFYIIEHGVRWTGMPSWDHTLSEQQVWQTVAFLSNIEKLPPAAMQVLGPQPAGQPPPSPSKGKGMHMPM